MDNNVLAVMNAIRDQESTNNYDAYNSDSGAFGAYQFMPDTWNDTANRYGFDPNDKSPANQDRMAYALMNEYYQQFGSPQAVAQAWYGGPGSVGSNVDGGAGYPDSDTYASEVLSRMGNTNATFNFNAKTPQNKTFINIPVNLRTSDQKEPFNLSAILGIAKNNYPSVKQQVDSQFVNRPDYSAMAGALPVDVAKYVQPIADTLSNNLVGVQSSNAAQNILQNNLQRGIEAVNLINSSNNVDNKNAYASIMKSIGIDLPSNADQYTTGKQLLGDAINQLSSDRNYDLQNQQMENQAVINSAKMGLLRDKLDHLNTMYSLAGDGGK